jgi:hypothetical protein
MEVRPNVLEECAGKSRFFLALHDGLLIDGLRLPHLRSWRSPLLTNCVGRDRSLQYEGLPLALELRHTAAEQHAFTGIKIGSDNQIFSALETETAVGSMESVMHIFRCDRYC